MFVTRDDVDAIARDRHGKRPRLSLCMIVRDNQDILEPCLAGIRPWVDEMIVVDTGSKDKTPAIAEAFGARVFRFPWCDDFSAARNESLRHARGQWLFWMDSDDTIDAENGRRLRELAYGAHQSNTLGYVMQVRCPAAETDADRGLTVVDHVKMFANFPQLRFEFRIHEQVLPSIRRLGGDVAWTDIYVTHSGADHSPEGIQRKYDRDVRILHRELEDKPDHPFVLFNLGMTHAHRGCHRLAVEFLRRCVRLSSQDESHVRKAYALLVSSLQAENEISGAWQVCEQGLEAFPCDAELLFRAGMLAHARGRLEDAEKAYRAALSDRDDRHFSSIDPGIVGYKARHNLAIAYRDMGRHDLAELQWRHVVAEAPDFREGQRSLGETLILQGKHVSAQLHIEGMLDDLFPCEAIALRARLAEASGELAAAATHLEDAVRQHPGDIDLVQAHCRFLFEHGEAERTEGALRHLIQLSPEDGAAYRNLGLVQFRAGAYQEAVAALRKSVCLRPGSAETWDQLAAALDAQGDSEEAAHARERAEQARLETSQSVAGDE